MLLLFLSPHSELLVYITFTMLTINTKLEDSASMVTCMAMHHNTCIRHYTMSLVHEFGQLMLEWKFGLLSTFLTVEESITDCQLHKDCYTHTSTIYMTE